MFSEPEFQAPPSRPQSNPERLIGLATLIAFIIMILIMAVTTDQRVINPYNTARPLTQTSQAIHTGSPRPNATLRATQRATRSPLPTPTSLRPVIPVSMPRQSR